MTSVVTLKKEVKKLKKQLCRDQQPHFIKGLYPFGEDGKLVHMIVIGDEIVYEPATCEEREAATRNWYERKIRSWKHLRERYPTFEDFWADRERFGFKKDDSYEYSTRRE